MTRSILILFLSFCFILPEISAQQLTPPQQKAVDKHFKTGKVVYFKFNVRSLQEIPQFAKIISVDKAVGMQVMAHADKKQFTQFIRLNIPYTVTAKSGKTQAKPKTKTPVKK
ncbi:MAG: hypothetical protein M3R27_03885 [Bacteroidota bacterium]|nr:hypothetical protein [Bacteroidota bacterium]